MHAASVEEIEPAVPIRNGRPSIVQSKTADIHTPAAREALPFGVVEVACRISRKELGKEINSFPKTGRAVWRLYDKNPASTGLRTQFITGFSDDCARQFTAAIALFGSSSLHERYRYADAQIKVPYPTSLKLPMRRFLIHNLDRVSGI